MPDEPVPPACLDARAKFGRALEDPAVEEAVLDHARTCLACMDAYLELQDTVKRLKGASEAIPSTETFSARVFDAIEQETGRRDARRRRLLALVLGAFLLGAGSAASAMLLAPHRFFPDETADTGSLAWEDAGPPEDAGSGPGEDEKDPGPEPGAEKTKPPGKDPAEALYEAYRTFEKGAGTTATAHGRGRGRRLYRMKHLFDRARGLGPDERKRLIEKLEATAEEARRFPEKRLRDDFLARLKTFQDRELRKHRRPGPRREEKK